MAMIGSRCYHHLACKVNLYTDRATCMLNDTALGSVFVRIDAAVTSDLPVTKSKMPLCVLAAQLPLRWP